MSFLLAASATTGRAFFEPLLAGSEIRVAEGETWNALAHADLALVASGTAAIEAALLETPMITFYRVHPASWFLGKRLLHVPFFNMVNVLAQRKVVPELIQNEYTADKLTAEARRLLEDPARLAQMRRELGEWRKTLAGSEQVMERAATLIEEVLRLEPAAAPN